LEQTDRVIAVLQDEPVLLGDTAKHFEAELGLKGSRGFEVLHGQTDGEVTKLHEDSFG